MHAGFFLNHVVMDPYPELLDFEMKKALVEYGMTQYCLVNGQTFRHYILNLEACSRICENPKEFDPEIFYKNWCARYFGSNSANEIVEIMKLWHAGQEDGFGYTKIMGNVTLMNVRRKFLKIKILPKKIILKQFEKHAAIGPDFTARLEKNVHNLQLAYERAIKMESKIEDQANFFYDHIVLPIKLLLELNRIALEFQIISYDGFNNTNYEFILEMMRKHHETRLEGDKNIKWATWYDPTKRRPNGGYPLFNEIGR
jgi:hypothetical protein